MTLTVFLPVYLLHVRTGMIVIQNSSAVLYHAWAVFCGFCGLTEAVCESQWSGESESLTQSEWPFVAQTPAELCLLLLK